jgi:prefoldin subunit 5
MTVAPLIAMKSTAVKSFEAVSKELDRRAHTYVNDVKPEHRHVGIRCREEDVEPVPLDTAVERRMGELNTKRKVRDDQVRAMGFIVSSNDFLPEPTAIEFLERSIDWMAERYGRENLLAAEIHLDEGTPHAHIWIAPVIHDDETGFDRLCAKELFTPDKRRRNADGEWEVTAQGTMSKLQEEFWEQVSSRWGYERPLNSSQRSEGYRSLEAYKVHVGTTRELQAQIDRTAERLESVRQRESELRERHSELVGQLGSIQGLEQAVASRPETLAGGARALSDARSVGERESVARERNQTLRSRISELTARIDALRARVSAALVGKGRYGLDTRRDEAARRSQQRVRERESAIGERNRELAARIAELRERAEQLRGRIEQTRGRVAELGERGVEAENRLRRARAQVDRVKAVKAGSPEEQAAWRKAFLAKNPRWRKKPAPKKKQAHESTGPSRRGPATRGQEQSRGRSR